MNGEHKVTGGHRARTALIYLRQSTLMQVREHTESTLRQYALADTAVAMGWAPRDVEVIDRDLGLSGTSAAHRQGFREPMSRVCLGETGAVFGLEISRLGRSNADLARLAEMARLTGTLLIDSDGVYDLTDFNDWLVLGPKSTMSQAELHIMAGRLQAAKRAAAERGELRAPLPVGLVYDDDGTVVTDPDADRLGAGTVQLAASASRVLPMPGSPVTATRAPRPAWAAASTESTSASALTRATSGYSTPMITPPRSCQCGRTCGCHSRPWSSGERGLRGGLAGPDVLVEPEQVSRVTTVASRAFRKRFPDALLERTCLLSARDRERAPEFGFDLIAGRAERHQEGRAQPPDLGLPQLGAAAHGQRLVGQREPRLRLPGGRVALEQQAGGDAGHTGRGRLAAGEVRAHRSHARDPLVRSAIQDGQVTGEQLGRQPHLGRTFVRPVSGQGQGVAAELRYLAAVHGEDGRPDPGDHAAVGMARLARGVQGQVTLAVGFTRVTEQPKSMGQAQPVGLDRGRGFGVATVRFPRSPHRTRRATLTAPGAPRALPCRQLLGAAGGPGVHGVGMLPPR